MDNNFNNLHLIFHIIEFLIDLKIDIIFLILN